MNEPTWVVFDVVIAVHQMLLEEHSGLMGIRDARLLDSALQRPRQHLSYNNKLSLFDLAAAYGYGLAKNHPFVDGNKRVALTISVLFLELNGAAFNAPEAEAALIIEQLAAGKIGEEKLSSWFKNSSAPLSTTT